MYNTLYLGSARKPLKNINEISIFHATEVNESLVKLQSEKIDAIVLDDHGSDAATYKKDLIHYISKTYLPISIIELNGNNKIKFEKFLGSVGALHVIGPSNEDSISEGIQLIVKHRKLEAQNFRKKYAFLRKTIIEALLQSLKIRDQLTYQHALRLEILLEAFGYYLQLQKDEILFLKAAALLHDIGKIGVLDSILNKTNKLTPVEYEIMKTHVELGCSVIEQFEDLKILLPIIRHHHERIDGQGYPDGIAKYAIPYLARILTIADIYDSLTSTRIYRGKRHFQYALQIMKEQEDKAFDKDLFQKFNLFIENSDILLKVYHNME